MVIAFVFGYFKSNAKRRVFPMRHHVTHTKYVLTRQRPRAVSANNYLKGARVRAPILIVDRLEHEHVSKEISLS